jgi:hypothetical protein
VSWPHRQPARASTIAIGRIESFAWDATVGCGRVGDRAPATPPRALYIRLSVLLGHAATDEERRAFDTAWTRCLQEAAQP